MTLLKRLLLPLGAFFALCGCSGADLLNLTVPRSGYSVHRDIAYGQNPRQQLDVYVPDAAAPGHPVILFFYGGSWQSGSKKDYLFAAQAFVSKGYVAVIADYRLYPEVYFPSFMDDGAQALVWVHRHINEYGGNPANLFLAGHSAGGYIAVMLALNHEYVERAGGRSAWIRGVIGIAGPYDFLPMTDPNIIALFSKAAAVDTQPITYAGPHAPPMLLVTGDADTEVYPKNTHNLTRRLREFGDSVSERTYPGVAHIGIALSLARGFRGKAPLLDDIADFVNAHAAK